MKNCLEELEFKLWVQQLLVYFAYIVNIELSEPLSIKTEELREKMTWFINWFYIKYPC